MNETEQLLLETLDQTQADLIAGMLMEEGIPFYVKRPGAGAIYSANKFFGIRVYVAAAGYEKAKELLSTYLEQLPEDIEFPTEFDLGEEE